MDVLSSVANLNRPIHPKTNSSTGPGMKPQRSDKKNQNSEFSSYMKDSSNNNQPEKSSNENQKNNYNVKSNSDEYKNESVANKNKKKSEDQVETGLTPKSEISDNSKAVTTLSEHINKIEKSKQEYVDPLTRRAAIQAFVSKMKAKFDIEPTQIVQSFSQLSVEELGLPPEKTMDKVIGQLPLQDSEKQQAQMFFTNMLDKTDASSMSEYLNTSEREYSLKALSDEQIKKEELDKSLVKLSENFFTPTKDPKAEQAISKINPSELNIMQKNSVKSDWMNKPDLDITKNIDASVSMNDKFGLESNNQNFYSQKAENINRDLSNYSAVDQQSLGEMSKNVEVNDTDLNFKKSEPQVLDLNKLAIDRQLQTKQVQTKADTSSDMESFSHDSLDPQIDISKTVNTGSQTQNTQEAKIFQNIIQQQTVTDADVEQNINKIIQGSQTMIKDGGGEMKIQMNPEGLGEVNLKVLVEDGNVNIEMIAENKDAKKLMEKGLLDLKANLASHKLNVDGIKIDVADQLQNQLNEEFQNQEREFARQFMQDFRQNNQGFREQFFTSPVDNFKSQTEDEADNDYLRTQTSDNKKNSNRRLDLVA